MTGWGLLAEIRRKRVFAGRPRRKNKRHYLYPDRAVRDLVVIGGQQSGVVFRLANIRWEYPD
jgi:hypothetical protein